MAFPATYNINYYMGDTHEFRVYPKDASGAVFPLAQYPTVKFTIAERRGAPVPGDQEPIEAYAAFSNDRTNILCSINNEHSANLDPAKQYVYDVQISKTGSPYDSVLTLLTGNITITNEVTVATTSDPTEAPGPITGLTLGDVSDSTINVSWTAPSTGGTPIGYYTYIVPYNLAYENSTVLSQLVAALPLTTPFEESSTSESFTQTTAISSLGISSEPLQPGTAYIYAVVAYNSIGSSSTVGNFDVIAGTVEETFTDGGS